MPVCDRIQVEVPADVQMTVENCALPEGVSEISPGDTLELSVSVGNSGADTGIGDLVIKATPAGADSPAVEIGREPMVEIPGQQETAVIFDVSVPQMANGEWTVFGTFENQRAVSV